MANLLRRCHRHVRFRFERESRTGCRDRARHVGKRNGGPQISPSQPGVASTKQDHADVGAREVVSLEENLP